MGVTIDFDEDWGDVRPERLTPVASPYRDTTAPTPEPQSLADYRGPFMVAFWMRTSALSTEPLLRQEGLFDLQMVRGQLYFRAEQQGRQVMTHDDRVSLTTGDWHLVTAGVDQRGGFSVTCDNERYPFRDTEPIPPNRFVGVAGSPTQVADVMVYDHVLRVDAMGTLYNGGSPGSPLTRGLLAHWNLGG